ncbi:hypothetical protein [Flavobacterium cellulosilyticum]|uniref:Uncharacterized protein n=1 Tax=Flavobacterium cellulosilyticum TaxID=2541731 RepID=A0A4R5C7X1_9FLAO|nr:hypothetical protein [Flavobacterium cellulosilyticum]TDD94210.1 hypothetical protein E0F76_17355 [Flavobacterium cellulosilyticum]
MKNFTNLCFFIILFSIQSFAHIKVTKISAKNKAHFITTKINYPILGLYQYENISEPIVILNADGIGIFQYKDLSKKDITWGLECTEDGLLRFKEGFDSSAYSLWYKTNDSLINPKSIETNDWNRAEFSIHFRTKKIYIMGERVKVYVD